MTSILAAIALTAPSDHYDKWIEFDRVIFLEEERFRPQRFGFGLGKTTEVKRRVIFQDQDIFGNWITIQEQPVEKFPEFHRKVGTFSLRFTILTHFWEHLGETYIWEWTNRPRRIETKQIHHHSRKVREDPH